MLGRPRSVDVVDVVDAGLLGLEQQAQRVSVVAMISERKVSQGKFIKVFEFVRRTVSRARTTKLSCLEYIC